MTRLVTLVRAVYGWVIARHHRTYDIWNRCDQCGCPTRARVDGIWLCDQCEAIYWEDRQW